MSVQGGREARECASCQATWKPFTEHGNYLPVRLIGKQVATIWALGTSADCV